MQVPARIISIVLISLLFSSHAITAQQDPQDERILLTFIPNIQFSPFYVGINEGYFSDHGFSVSLEYLQEPEVLDLVAAGHADFGIVSGEQVILARAQGRDVVYVFEWFQKYPVGIISSWDAVSEGLQGLRGKKVGIPGRFGASYSGLTTLLHNAGLSEADVQIEEIGFNAPEVFCAGFVDAAVVYINNEPLQVWRRFNADDCADHDSIAVMAVAAEVDLVSNGLIVSADLLQRDPEKVSRMVSALRGALEATINNPAKAYLASLDFVDNLPADEDMLIWLETLASQQDLFLQELPSREQIAESRSDIVQWLLQNTEDERWIQLDVLLRTIDLWDAETLGYSDLASWESMRDTLELMAFLDDAEFDLSAAFSNDFVAGVDE